jgi:hypothetical protein
MNAIVKPQETLPATRSDSPMQMLQAAIENKLDTAIIKDMMDLRERWEASEARKAYMEAIAAFKANPPKVIKDKLNKQYNSMYSSLANLVNNVNAALSVHGLNARWDIKQAEKEITVTCILSHVMGHSERVDLTAPPDTSGSKNSLQQIKSTITYLKIATYEAVTGIASEEGNMDDDGNSAGDKYADWLAAIDEAATQDDLNATKKRLVESFGGVDAVPAKLRTACTNKAKALKK